MTSAFQMRSREASRSRRARASPGRPWSRSSPPLCSSVGLSGTFSRPGSGPRCGPRSTRPCSAAWSRSARPGHRGRDGTRRVRAPPLGRAPSDGKSDVALWDRLSDLVDPTSLRPKLANHVEIREFPLKWGNDYVMVANTRDLVHYRLPASERPLLEMMDGTRTVKELVLEEFESTGDLDPDSVTDIVRTLYEGNFFEQENWDVDELVARALDPASDRRRMARTFAKTLTIEWKKAHEVVQWLYDHGLKYAFLKPVIAVQVVVAIAGLVAFVDLVVSGRFTLNGASLAASFIALWILDYFSVVIHELGHAVILIRNGRRIKSAGFMIYFGSPAFFVESADSPMRDRRQQIVSSAAGPYAETVLASLSSLIIWWFPDWFLSQALFVAAALNYYLVMMNLIPLLELDGYFILADVI